MTGVFDFESDSYEGFVTPALVLTLSNEAQPFTLLPDSEPAGNGTRIAVLGLVFLQEKNGELYELKEGSYLGL